MDYRTVADLSADTRRLSSDLPTNIDLVVGIPRSGLLPANLLCLYLNVPMTDVDGLCEGRLLGTGHRYDGDTAAFADVDRVLVVDDSVRTGQQMTATRERLEAQEFPFEIEYAAVYVSAEGYRHVDYWAEIVTTPRAFEWNLLHHPNLEDWCVDLDGVLCRDSEGGENDGGERPRAFPTTVEPDIVPSKEIGWLVTCRPEQDREQIEAWLEEYGIEYRELVMADLPDEAGRRTTERRAASKADAYESTGADLFVESSPAQATEIAERTGKPVYCFEQNRLVEPGTLRRAYNRGPVYLSRLARNPVSFPLSAGKLVLERGWHRLTAVSHRLRS